jgi:hypothetical protein
MIAARHRYAAPSFRQLPHDEEVDGNGLALPPNFALNEIAWGSRSRGDVVRASLDLHAAFGGVGQQPSIRSRGAAGFGDGMLIKRKSNGLRRSSRLGELTYRKRSARFAKNSFYRHMKQPAAIDGQVVMSPLVVETVYPR